MTYEQQLFDVRCSVSNQYTLGATIGTGHFAVVKLAQHKFTQREVAIKVIDKTKLDEISKAHLFQEVKCMKLVQHPNVVRLYDVIDTTNKLYLILELADGGDMYDYIMKHANGFSESLARRYFRQICRALKYCHEMYVCHRDLKPENLVFFEKQGIVKLTDFGFSNQFSPGTKLATSCGSLAYSAPEILLCDPYEAPAVDIWSLGVILYMLVTGRPPFQEANDYETVMKILDCSYKIPSHISSECQSLIRRMIVLKPEERATLDAVMSDIWYRQSDEDEDDDEPHDTDLLKLLSSDDHKSILCEMVSGNIADQEIIGQALKECQYNYITATYYLLAEKVLHEKLDTRRHNIKRPRRALQSHNEPFKEQCNVPPSSSVVNFFFDDGDLSLSSRSSLDEDSNDFSGKENVASISNTPKHVFDPSGEQTLSALVEDDEELPSVQQRTINTNIAVNPAQAMKIILEEDENPELVSTDETDVTPQQSNNLFKLSKIAENGAEDNDPSTFVETSTTTSSVLHSKDLRSVVETKRRNFIRSYSSSDSDDNGSTCDIPHYPIQRRTRSPTSYQEAEPLINHRGRSLSNIEHVSQENPFYTPQRVGATQNSENTKRRSFSRANSATSSNRFTSAYPNEDMNTDSPIITNSTSFNDRSRSLSIEHRLANQSQISIGSRTSMRCSTPRESVVFTKADGPIVARLLQKAQSQEVADIARHKADSYWLQVSTSHQENNQTPIIVEEDASLSALTHSNRNLKSSQTSVSNSVIQPDDITPLFKSTDISNGHVPTKPQSTLSILRQSLIKHQQQQQQSNSQMKSCINDNDKHKHSTSKCRMCCIIM